MKAALSEPDFARARDLLARAAGLVFDDSRRDSLAYSLGERVGARGLASVDAYLELLDRPGSGDELQALLDEVTIQETHFFRNPPQFRALREHVLPQLVSRAVATGSRTLRVWSAGCSTGEEPYSVAMLLRELLPSTDGWDVRVVATDVSTRALAAAREGRYGGRALLAADPADVARWFVRDGDDYVVRPEVRELVEFRHHNLVTEPVPFPRAEPLDLLLCRNVTIYFSRETTRGLMARFHESLADGGYLFLGHSETLWQVNDAFRLVTLGDAFVYRRDAAADAGAAERRTVLPDRRTGDDGTPDSGDRRVHRGDRRAAWNALTKPRALPFPRPARTPAPDRPALADLVEAVRVALRSGRYEEAAADAVTAVDADPMRAETYYLHALALANLGRDADALVALRKAVYIDPAAGFAHFLLAGVLARLGDASGAARSYRAAAETLGRSAGDDVAVELGGRSVDELVELCWRLAGERRG
ncbi:MAG: chemotaxis protein methyltransferase CheR [Frankiaceae bacterium]|nr:chemotaxis protein methyltransferase CheR [Frankiaceae bacterium]